MIRPVAAITTVRYDATYQCEGFTQSKAALGVVPNAPPMISMVTTGNANTKTSVSGSRTISLSSVRTRRPTVVFIALLQSVPVPARWAGVRCNRVRPRLQKADQGVLQAGNPHGKVRRDRPGLHQQGTDLGDGRPVAGDRRLTRLHPDAAHVRQSGQRLLSQAAGQRERD